MVSLIRAAAEKSYKRRLEEYAKLVEQERKDLAAAAAEQRPLINYDWKPRFDAEQKKEAAAKLLAVVIEEEGKEGL